jgi:hypothetical protein
MNLEIVCKKQSELDSQYISRERTVEDIAHSIIAECIEFNEEEKYEYKHKTWKKPEKFSITKRNLELVDIFFFIAQLINKCEKASVGHLDMVMKENIDRQNTKADTRTLSLKVIREATYIESKDSEYVNAVLLEDLMEEYGKLVGACGVSYDRLMELYNEKWFFNLKREDHSHKGAN